MPFVSDTDKRSLVQNAVQNTNIPSPTFRDTFEASLGLTIDEELSISGVLNREGWENRQRLIKKKIDDSQLDRSKYLDARGKFDYNRAAIDLNDPEIKTDEVLTQERNQMLANRRAYAQDVIERGEGMAQFLGMANAFVLDPISIATMPIALPGNAAKSLSIAGRSLLTARNVAAIETATELAIQPFVFEHKQDIESPYTYRDALENIGAAAVGGAALGGVVGGVSGYLRRVVDSVDERGVVDLETDFALDNLNRMADTVDYGRANRQTIDPVIEDYGKVLNGDLELEAAAKATKRTLNKTIKSLDEAGEDSTLFKNELDELTLAISEDNIEGYYRAAKQRDVDSDIEYLNELETQRTISGSPQTTQQDFFIPPPEKSSNATASDRERFLLDEDGTIDDYNADMARFSEIENPRVQDEEGNFLNATEEVARFNEEIEGLESVLVCARG